MGIVLAEQGSDDSLRKGHKLKASIWSNAEGQAKQEEWNEISSALVNGFELLGC